MQVFDFSPMKLSLNTCVNLLALNGKCVPLRPKARMHSFKANSDLLISAPSIPGKDERVVTRIYIYIQGQDRLTSLPVGGRRVGSSLVSGKIDQREFSMNFMGGRCTGYDLKHGVRPRRVGIGACLPAGPRAVPVLYQFQYLVARLHHLLRQSDNLHLKKPDGGVKRAWREKKRREEKKSGLTCCFPSSKTRSFSLSANKSNTFPE